MRHRLWQLVREWLHQHGQHRFCRVVRKRVEIGRDYRERWLVGERDDEPFKVDATVFGGDPVYGTQEVHR
jgi:hypothetical protein